MLWPWPWKNGWAPDLLIGKLVLEASLQIQKKILLNPSSPFSSLGVSTPLTGSDFSSVVAVSWAWSDEAMPELPDFPKRSGDTAEVRKLRLMKPVQDATWGTPWWRVDELAAHLCKIQTFVPYNISQYHLIEHGFSSHVEAARTSSSKVLQVELQPHFPLVTSTQGKGKSGYKLLLPEEVTKNLNLLPLRKVMYLEKRG